MACETGAGANEPFAVASVGGESRYSVKKAVGGPRPGRRPKQRSSNDATFDAIQVPSAGAASMVVIAET